MILTESSPGQGWRDSLRDKVGGMTSRSVSRLIDVTFATEPCACVQPPPSDVHSCTYYNFPTVPGSLISHNKFFFVHGIYVVKSV